jgi:hypothetical protein
MKNVIAALIAGLFATAVFASDAPSTSAPADPASVLEHADPKPKAKPPKPAKIKTNKTASTAPK